jgi:hypothetical protein
MRMTNIVTTSNVGEVVENLIHHTPRILL